MVTQLRQKSFGFTPLLHLISDNMKRVNQILHYRRLAIWNRSKAETGFTLMELLIVIAIIAVLISVATASYSSAQQKSRNSRRTADMKSIQNAMEQYYANTGGYTSGAASTNCNDLTATATYLPAGYPRDPKPSQSYTRTCSYTSYTMCAQLEGTTTGGNASTDTGGNYGNCGGSCTYFCVINLQ